MISDRIVHWGDCAPSGAVFYPTYYRWFDEATWDFFAEHDLAIAALGERYGVVGLPLMSCRAEFRGPCRLGDRLAVDTAIAAADGRSIVLSHLVYNRGRLAVRGEEVRFWGVRSPDAPERLVRGAMPEEVAARIGALVRPMEEERQWPARG